MFAFLSRVALLAFALCAVCWGTAAISAGWESRPVDTMAQDLSGGLSYAAPEMTTALTGEDGKLFGFCWARRLRSIAIVKLSIFESAAIQASADAQSLAHDAREAIEAALACAPNDGFLWLTMLNLDAFERPLNPRYELIALSKKIAPYEGWILARRARIGVSVWDRLDEHLRHDVLADFNLLFQKRLLDSAADTVASVDGPARKELLESLNSSDPVMLGALAKLLLDRGVRDQTISWLTAAESFHR